MKTWGEREASRAGEPCIDLLVDDVDDVYQRLTNRGVKFSGEPRDAIWGARIANFTDPDGNALQLTGIRWTEYLATMASRS